MRRPTERYDVVVASEFLSPLDGGTVLRYDSCVPCSGCRIELWGGPAVSALRAYAVLHAVEPRVLRDRSPVAARLVEPWNGGAIRDVSVLQLPPLARMTARRELQCGA